MRDTDTYNSECARASTVHKGEAVSTETQDIKKISKEMMSKLRSAGRAEILTMKGRMGKSIPG